MRVNIAGLTPAFSANATQGMPVLFRYRLMSSREPFHIDG